MTKLRFITVLLIAVVGVYILAAVEIVSTAGMSDGGGFG